MNLAPSLVSKLSKPELESIQAIAHEYMRPDNPKRFKDRERIPELLNHLVKIRLGRLHRL